MKSIIISMKEIMKKITEDIYLKDPFLDPKDRIRQSQISEDFKSLLRKNFSIKEINKVLQCNEISSATKKNIISDSTRRYKLNLISNLSLYKIRKYKKNDYFAKYKKENLPNKKEQISILKDFLKTKVLEDKEKKEVVLISRNNLIRHLAKPDGFEEIKKSILFDKEDINTILFNINKISNTKKVLDIFDNDNWWNRLKDKYAV